MKFTAITSILFILAGGATAEYKKRGPRGNSDNKEQMRNLGDIVDAVQRDADEQRHLSGKGKYGSKTGDEECDCCAVATATSEIFAAGLTACGTFTNDHASGSHFIKRVKPADDGDDRRKLDWQSRPPFISPRKFTFLSVNPSFLHLTFTYTLLLSTRSRSDLQFQDSLEAVDVPCSAMQKSPSLTSSLELDALRQSCRQ